MEVATTRHSLRSVYRVFLPGFFTQYDTDPLTKNHMCVSPWAKIMVFPPLYSAGKNPVVAWEERWMYIHKGGDLNCGSREGLF